MNQYFRLIILIIVLGAIIGAVAFLESKKVRPALSSNPAQAVIPLPAINKATASAPTKKAKQYSRAREIVSPSGFINTDPPGGITIAQLIGKKVVLVDFWTYSCINCQRTLPYINAWYKKYKDKGLEIVSLHTPEFEFEKQYDNVKKAVARFGIKYPVVLDNDYGTWSAYGNRYWPRKYLIDIDGYIVYDHIGEGGYDETEQKIQALLQERMERLGLAGQIDSSLAHPTGTQAIDQLVETTLSPETYFGAARNVYLGNGESRKLGLQSLTIPKNIAVNTLYLDGDWDFTREYAQNRTENATIVYKYQAKRVFLVASAKAGVDIEILLDGKPITRGAGKDVQIKNGRSMAHVQEDRLYNLIDAEYGEHVLQIIIAKPGIQAFTFTFG